MSRFARACRRLFLYSPRRRLDRGCPYQSRGTSIMTTTPSDPALNGPWVTEPGVPAPGLPAGLPPGPPSPRAGRARMVALVGGLLGIVGVATLGAAYAYQRVGGGGPQPESVMPSTVAAFVKVDLDPSGSQKLDAIRFALKFPQDKVSLREDS